MRDIAQIEQAFFGALARPEHERAAFLQRECAGDGYLLAEVQSLLAHAPRVEPEFLAPNAHTLSHEDIRRALGAMDADLQSVALTKYSFRGLLGEGSMGVVYHAQQAEPLPREVAIKIMRFGMNLEQSRARFELEQRALAIMEHPNIARVFEAGVTDSSRPYIAMEYVVGRPITDHCAAAGLSLHERLELFLQACEGVQHAHQKGIIHRDLKPSNILVAANQEQPCVKIIDFSIAKPIAGVPSTPSHTRHGELLGTINYMAPEQLGGNNEDVDTRADIYGLGVVLYEILTGSCPLEFNLLDYASLDEMRRARLLAAPMAPSVCVKQRAAPTGEMAQQQMDPRERRWLIRQLGGDLDWIVLKAIDADRKRRYGTATEFAADIRRHLAREPVLARAPSKRYRIGKFIARHQTSVIATAIIVFLILLSLTGVTWQGLVAAQARRSELENSYYAAITGAYSEIDAREFANAARLLAGAPPIHRGWEWHFLKSGLDSSYLSMQLDAQICALALSPKQDLLVAGDSAGCLRFLNPATLQPITVAHPSTSPINCLAFNPDGSLIAFGDYTGNVHVWRSAERTEIAAFPFPGRVVLALAFSPDGTHLAIARYESPIEIRELASQEIWSRFSPGTIYSIAFVGNETLAGARQKGGVCLWDARSGRLLKELSTELTSCVAFSGATNMLACGQSNGIVRLCDLSGAIQAVKFEGGGAKVAALTFSADGKRLAWASDHLAHFCNLAPSLSEIHTLTGHTGVITSLALDASGERVFSGAHDNTIRLWSDLSEQDQRRGLVQASADSFNAGNADRTGRKIVAIDHGRVRLWQVDRNLEPISPSIADGEVRCTALSPAGDVVALGVSNRLMFWDTSTLNVQVVHTAPAAIDFVRFSHGGERIAIASGVDIQILDTRGQAPLITLGDLDAGSVKAMDFSPTGDWLAFAGDDSTLRLRNVRTGAPRVFPRQDVTGIFAVAFSPDGKTIATAGAKSEVTLWNTDTESVICKFNTASERAFSLAFSTDSSRLFVGVARGTVQVWRTRQQDRILSLRDNTGRIMSLSVIDDGRLVAMSSTGRIRFRDGTPVN